MRPRASLVALCWLAAAALVAWAPAEAQAAPRPTSIDAIDPALQGTVANLRSALTVMSQADRELMPAEGSSTLRGADEVTLERRARARAAVVAGLDTLLRLGPRGRTAIRALAADWPGADLVRRYEIRAALLAPDATEALRLAEQLGTTVPRDTEVIGWRADALDALGRAEEALRARQARFELAPEDAGHWRDLLAAHTAANSLPQLRLSLARLRLLYPHSKVLREHEVEVLHRLGRNEEAARIAADTTGGSP